MLRLMLNSKSSLLAHQQKMDNISNNISNIDTTAYKKTDVNFEDLVYDTLKRKGYPVSRDGKTGYGLQNGTGIKIGRPIKNNRQGSLMKTEIKTDLAIDGRGYFEIIMNDGSKAYTRDGSFRVDLHGHLVDASGNYVNVIDEKGKTVYVNNIDSRLTNEDIFVNEDGEVFAKGENSDKKIGSIVIKDFIGNDALIPISGNLNIPKEGAQSINASGSKIYQGFLEQSNVDIEEEMVDMIVTQRAFQLSSSSLKTADEMWSLINNLKK
ncbi:flagellar basal-body rod protein FlgG [Clostridium tepidiprofundi DSM 19306]|uniref:Flagellar basal-body rod protein FlgG n=1 Tax=Clostridium tepidiprofundi DSM 19306 TaxID=1121338 RepID=A0A151B744_9CLOT|nr:flagellar hook-basal body complex protein [Clostridium tepidiprofundi]KYH35623.1 flagellar basal-body rod protein FlgG [Clostridium tepidiprofundi DSM 19306]